MDRKHHKRNSIKLTCGNNYILYLYYIRMGWNINIIYKPFRFCSDGVVILSFQSYCSCVYIL